MTELKCRKSIKFVICYTCFNWLTFVFALIYAIYAICIGNVDTSTWMLPLNIAVPFNTEVIWGWFIKWLYEFYAAISYALNVSLTPMYFVSLSFYTMTTCHHLGLLIESLQQDLTMIQNVKIKMHRQQTWSNINKKLNEAVTIHAQIYKYAEFRWSKDFCWIILMRNVYFHDFFFQNL